MKTKLTRDEELLAEEVAGLYRRWECVGGRLYVTDRRLIFEPHALNFQRVVAEIPLDDIEDVRPCNTLWVVPNGMEVRTRDGAPYHFCTWNRQALMEVIFYQLNSPRPDDRERRPTPPAARPANPGVRRGASAQGTRRAEES